MLNSLVLEPPENRVLSRQEQLKHFGLTKKIKSFQTTKQDYIIHSYYNTIITAQIEIRQLAKLSSFQLKTSCRFALIHFQVTMQLQVLRG